MVKHGRWVVALVLGSMFVFAIFVVANAWPDSQATDDVADNDLADAPVQVAMTLDSIDASAGTVRLSIQANGNPCTTEAPTPCQESELGRDGATLVTSLPGVEPFVLPKADFTPPSTSTVHVDGGDVDEYPFDNYELRIALKTYEGTVPATDEALLTGTDVPFAVDLRSGLSGFDATATIVEESGVTMIEVDINRRGPTIAWAVAMMAIYWLLASAALAVAVAILVGIRPFETRHLAWLTTIIFAFAAFRNTAPGAPPIGVFFDFASFFWAVGIVVIAELLLLGYYLFRKKSPDT